MEHLVFTYHGGDGYTYSYTDHIPFEYESKEKALSDFFDIAYEALEKSLKGDNFSTVVFFGGLNHWGFPERDFPISSFFYIPRENEKIMKKTNINAWEYMEPQILTLEEWFDANREEIYQKVVDSEK